MQKQQHTLNGLKVDLLRARKGYILKVANKTSSRGLISLFEKILLPLDGSEHSLRALEIAVQMAKKFDGKITLIHVYPGVWQTYVIPVISPEPPTLSEIGEAAHNAGVAILADGEKKVEAEGVEVETLLRGGHTVEEIIKAGREGEFDLIVMGARGLSGIKELVLGSVSAGVISHACCPVLVVR